jgi:hypothetical protein
MDVDRSGLPKRKVPRITVLNLATLAFIVAYLILDWWAIAYLISH